MLTMDQMSEFYRRGFIALQQITTPQDLGVIRDLLAGLFDRFDQLPKDLAIDLGGKKSHAGAQRIPQINSASTLEPRLLQTQYFKNATAVARQVLGEKSRLNFDHAIYKPPHNGKETPWHQDLAYPARVHPNTIRFGMNFWMPLQDASVESGCMQFVPYSNLGNLLPHHPVGNDPEVHTLETDAVDKSKAVACPVPAGGCTIHQPKTLHYTGPNQTDQWRRVWILNFASELGGA
jgi:hypothetical protein